MQTACNASARPAIGEPGHRPTVPQCALRPSVCCDFHRSLVLYGPGHVHSWCSTYPASISCLAGQQQARRARAPRAQARFQSVSPPEPGSPVLAPALASQQQQQQRHQQHAQPAPKEQSSASLPASVSEDAAASSVADARQERRTAPATLRVRPAEAGEFWAIADLHACAFYPRSTPFWFAALRLDRVMSLQVGQSIAARACQGCCWGIAGGNVGMYVHHRGPSSYPPAAALQQLPAACRTRLAGAPASAHASAARRVTAAARSSRPPRPSPASPAASHSAPPLLRRCASVQVPSGSKTTCTSCASSLRQATPALTPQAAPPARPASQRPAAAAAATARCRQTPRLAAAAGRAAQLAGVWCATF